MSRFRSSVFLRTAAVVTGASLALAALVSVFLSPSTANSNPVTLSCAPRVVVVDLSSADRSPQLSNLALHVIESAADTAVVCNSQLGVYGVAGGGEDTSILTNANLAAFTPVGPNARVRSSRFSASTRRAVAALVAARLRKAYRIGDPSITSIAALYQLAAEQSTSNTIITLLTTGVNEDSMVNLNRPLGAGQGTQLARQVSIPRVAAKEIVLVGIAQVDATLAPPSPQWPTQIWDFNNSLCHAASPHCRLYTIASVPQALGS